MYKKLGLLLAIILGCKIFSVCAMEMQGTLIDNSNGTYSVEIETIDGMKQFYGNAYAQADGTLTITVNGQSDETYIGVAKKNKQGGYTMQLRNNVSGNLVNGELQVEE